MYYYPSEGKIKSWTVKYGWVAITLFFHHQDLKKLSFPLNEPSAYNKFKRIIILNLSILLALLQCRCTGKTQNFSKIREAQPLDSSTSNYTMMWMLRALWLVVAHDLLEYRYINDVTRNLFSLFCSTWHAVLKMFVSLFWIEASESFGKHLAGAIYKEKKWRNGDQKSYWLLDNG